ncbi:MAG: hypothetical protein R2716_11665 [Microthrixaceae bacterium]
MRGLQGFVTVGEYSDGRPGASSSGSPSRARRCLGIMDAFAISVSHGLRVTGCRKIFVGAFVGMRFEPAGMTDDPGCGSPAA